MTRPWPSHDLLPALTEMRKIIHELRILLPRRTHRALKLQGNGHRCGNELEVNGILADRDRSKPYPKAVQALVA